MRNVTYAFETGRPILSDFSMTVGRGERVGIVAGHGAGKSLLADLLVGFRQPGSGRVELDGVDLRELNLRSIRERVAIVRGGGVIEGSVEENVRIGRAGITSDACREALREVGLLDEIRAFPDGVAARMSPSGAPLSDGQVKRLMIARAIVGAPGVIVVDDLLDDLDADARQQVLGALLAPEKNWTVIVLSRHDLKHAGFHRVVPMADHKPPAAPVGTAGAG